MAGQVRLHCGVPKLLNRPVSIEEGEDGVFVTVCSSQVSLETWRGKIALFKVWALAEKEWSKSVPLHLQVARPRGATLLFPFPCSGQGRLLMAGSSVLLGWRCEGAVAGHPQRGAG